jgi:hypothetical protein
MADSPNKLYAESQSAQKSKLKNIGFTGKICMKNPLFKKIINSNRSQIASSDRLLYIYIIVCTVAASRYHS